MRRLRWLLFILGGAVASCASAAPLVMPAPGGPAPCLMWDCARQGGDCHLWTCEEVLPAMERQLCLLHGRCVEL